MYAIKRTDQGGGYLAPPPISGWTKRLHRARLFVTHEQADRERCPENEIVVEVKTGMTGPGLTHQGSRRQTP